MKGMLIILGMKSMDIRMDAGRVQCIRTARSLSINVDYSVAKFMFEVVFRAKQLSTPPPENVEIHQ